MRKLIGFGASSMEGAGDSQGGFLRRLAAKLAREGLACDCINQGIGGQTTRDMVARLDRVRPHLPCDAVVLLGCNDMPRERDDRPGVRVPLAEFAANVETILRAFSGPDTIFVSSFPVCPRRTGVDPQTFGQYVGASLEAAASLKARTWNLHAEMLASGDAYLAKDGLHFLDEGHEMIAARLFTMIAAAATGRSEGSA